MRHKHIPHGHGLVKHCSRCGQVITPLMKDEDCPRVVPPAAVPDSVHTSECAKAQHHPSADCTCHGDLERAAAIIESEAVHLAQEGRHDAAGLAQWRALAARLRALQAPREAPEVGDTVGWSETGETCTVTRIEDARIWGLWDGPGNRESFLPAREVHIIAKGRALQATPPAPPVGEDRSEPPRGYCVHELRSGQFHWDADGSDEGQWSYEEAVAACWAHRDSVLASAAQSPARDESLSHIESVMARWSKALGRSDGWVGVTFLLDATAKMASENRELRAASAATPVAAGQHGVSLTSADAEALAAWARAKTSGYGPAFNEAFAVAGHVARILDARASDLTVDYSAAPPVPEVAGTNRLLEAKWQGWHEAINAVLNEVANRGDDPAAVLHVHHSQAPSALSLAEATPPGEPAGVVWMTFDVQEGWLEHSDKGEALEVAESVVEHVRLDDEDPGDERMLAGYFVPTHRMVRVERDDGGADFFLCHAEATPPGEPAEPKRWTGRELLAEVRKHADLFTAQDFERMLDDLGSAPPAPLQGGGDRKPAGPAGKKGGR